MDINKAREIVSALAGGTDPMTGEALPADHVCNQTEVVRALYMVLSRAADRSRPGARLNMPPKEDGGRPSNAGKPWTATADSELRKLFGDGKRINEISEYLERSIGAIESRLEKLGLKDKPDHKDDD
ncbi:MAG: hypothetical protein IKD96_02810 [Oscillospiraceae bacterium]|nr:hypothetical protein [Oscillospiraceae bacterium]